MWKRLGFLFGLLLLLSGSAMAQFTTTTNVALKKPNAGLTSGWDVYINGDWDAVDALLGGINTLTQNNTTPSINTGGAGGTSYAKYWQTNNTSTTAITNFTGGYPGQQIVVFCNDTKTSLTVGSTISLLSPFSCTSTSSRIALVLIGTVWTENGRNSPSYHVCDIAVGDTSASAITNGQLGPQKRVCFIPAAATVVEVDVSADGGTPNVIVGKNTAGTQVNLLSAALATAASGGIACSNTGGTTGVDGATTCSSTLQNTTVAAGAYFELVSGTAGGTAKFMTIHIVYTEN